MLVLLAGNSASELPFAGNFGMHPNYGNAFVSNMGMDAALASWTYLVAIWASLMDVELSE